MNEKIIQIIGKNLAGVESTLGKVESSYFVKPGNTSCKEFGCLKGYFDSGRYEIVFIDGVADWITIHNRDGVTANEFIQQWGLDKIKPDFNNPNWGSRIYDLYGMKEIQLTDNGLGGISYIYIKAFTE